MSEFLDSDSYPVWPKNAHQIRAQFMRLTDLVSALHAVSNYLNATFHFENVIGPKAMRHQVAAFLNLKLVDLQDAMEVDEIIQEEILAEMTIDQAEAQTNLMSDMTEGRTQQEIMHADMISRGEAIEDFYAFNAGPAAEVAQQVRQARETGKQYGLHNKKGKRKRKLERIEGGEDLHVAEDLNQPRKQSRTEAIDEAAPDQMQVYRNAQGEISPLL